MGCVIFSHQKIGMAELSKSQVIDKVIHSHIYPSG